MGVVSVAELVRLAQKASVVPAAHGVWMPRTSCLEVQSRLRLLSLNTKVVVVTGQEVTGIRATALGGGAFAFLMKPFDDEVFLSLVRQALRSEA